MSGTTTVDTDAGTWVTTITFNGPRTAANDAELDLGLQFLHGSESYRTNTAPTELAAHREIDGVEQDASYDPTQTVLTVRVADPLLAQRPRVLNVLGVVYKVGDNLTSYSGILIPLGPRAPAVRIPAANRHLVVHSDGSLRLRLSPPQPAARQTIAVLLPDRRYLFAKALPASMAGRRSLTIPTPHQYRAALWAKLSTRPRKAILQVTTSLINGSVTVTRQTVTIRRPAR